MPSSGVKESLSKSDYRIIESLSNEGWVTLSVDNEDGDVVKISLSYGLEDDGQIPSSFPTKLVNKFSKLKNLEITDTFLPKLSKSFLAGAKMEELVIIDSEVEIIEEAAFDGLELTYLNLTGNLIRELKTKSFSGCSKITEVNFGENQISVIEEDLWSQFPNLETLLLNNNQLESLSKNSFSKLEKLLYLDLGENWIGEIEEGSFSGIPLEVLKLHGNNLSELPKGLFVNTPSLIELVIEDNEIISIDSDILKSLPNLEVLIFSNNSFEELPNMSSCKNLKAIIADENVINILAEDSLSQLVLLDQIDLSANDISSLPPKLLAGLKHLTYFYASDNMISEIPKDFFKDAKDIVEIDLSDCEITSVDVDPIKYLTKLKKFSIIEGNELAIDNLKSLTALEKLGVYVD